MQLIWERKKPDAESKAGVFCLVALLIDGDLGDGSTEQNIILQLGSVEERFLTSPICTMREFHQGLFWAAVDRRLDQLDLDTDSIAAIEKEISFKIPRPGDEWALWGVTCIPRFDPQ